MAADLEISQSGIRTSYVRFLADSAPGYVTLGLLAHGFREDLQQIPAASTLGAGLLLGAVVIGPPIGLFINAVGWFSPLGPIQARIGKAFVESTKLRWLSGPTKEFADIELLTDRARAEGKSIVDWGNHADVLLQVHHATAYASISHVYGLKQLARSLSMILPVGILVFWGLGGWQVFLAVVVLIVVLFIAGCLDGYQHLRALSLLMAIEAGPKACRLNRSGKEKEVDDRLRGQ